MKNAIERLKISLAVVENNEPINRARGDIAQADLEAQEATAFRLALAELDRWARQ